MTIIRNNIIPFPGFKAMNFYGLLFVRKKSILSDIDINHENIHTEQMKDFCNLLIIGGTIFYIWYVLEWLYRVLFTKDRFSHQAYKNIRFEREAFQYQIDIDYLINRPIFNWMSKNL